MLKLENERQRILFRLKLLKILMFLGLVACVYICQVRYIDEIMMVFVGYVFICIILYSIAKTKLSKSIVVNFKDEIILNIINELSATLTYDKSGYINQDEFDRCQIYPSGLKRYIGNDLISGVKSGVDIRLSDIYATKQIQTNNKSKEIVVFKGIFAICEFNKKIRFKTYIIDKKAKIFISDKSRAYMDDSEFEARFNVYCTDQIDARYILTPRFMQDFIKLKNEFKCIVNACFMDNRMYLFLELNKDSFEIRLDVKISEENIKIYKNEIEQILNIVEILRLNDDMFIK
ncbi:DUF3137 domain-containing protein [Campylobacter majalis]|uniref:DUF3137 domain-containing protein n=1 Tax=Campylobacter majalis TaxID=2790656 RepID=UPI003D69EF13